MRILRVIRSVNPKGGGPVEAIRQVSRIMEELGHSVEVASLDPAGVPWVSDFPLKVYPLGSSRNGYGFSRRFLHWMRAQHFNYDAVIVSGLWQYSGFGTWRALRRTETPYFIFPHGMLDPWFKRAYPLKHLKKWLYWPWAEYRVLKDARAVLFTCEEECLLARQSFWLYSCNERVVNYGAAGPPDEDLDRQRDVFVNRFPEAKGKRLLLFLSRIHEKKGCDLVIRAFGNIVRQGIRHDDDPTPLHLAIAGPCASPSYGQDLRALAGPAALKAPYRFWECFRVT